MVRGDFLASDGQQPVFTKNIMNDTGTATIQLNRQPGTPGVNGGGVLVTLNFQADRPRDDRGEHARPDDPQLAGPADRRPATRN